MFEVVVHDSEITPPHCTPVTAVRLGENGAVIQAEEDRADAIFELADTPPLPTACTVYENEVPGVRLESKYESDVTEAICAPARNTV